MAATAPTLIVKMTDGAEIRRFTSGTDTLTYRGVHQRATEAFHPPSHFKMAYKDDEGDEITIDTDDELAEAVALALSNEPAVLRLHLKPSTSGTRPATKEGEQPKPSSTGVPAAPAEPPSNQGASNQGAGAPAAPDLSQLIQNITMELPSLVNQLPAAIQRMIPRAELDVEATLNATAAAAASAAAHAAATAASAASTATAADGAPTHSAFSAPLDPKLEGFHPGVTCDRTNMSPIIGVRYNLVGHDYDLCESEFQKLTEADKLRYRPIAPPVWRPKCGAEPPPSRKDFAGETPTGFHPGVTCDKSGMCPIVGYRYHLIGRNYDLCQAEFDKLPAEEQANFQRIAPPVCRPRGGFGGSFGGGPFGQ